MVQKPLIIFATLDSGGGHVATAKAMLQAIESSFPNRFDFEVSDLMHNLGQIDPVLLKLDKRNKELWKRMLKYPISARLGQRLIDSIPKSTVLVHRFFLKRFAKLAASELNKKQPQLIVANHGWLTVGLTLAQRKYGLTSPVLTFATEPLDASALWAEWQAEHFVAPSQAVKKDLIRLGIPEKKIDVVGYPVQQAFLQQLSKEEARKKLNLSKHPTCLVSLGGEGVGGKTMTIVKSLLSHPLKPQVVVIAGRNQKLLNQLINLNHSKLHPKGFINNMADYLAACDVVIGKAGPASVMETLAVGRPLLVTSYAGINELKLCKFLEKEGLGQRIKIRQLSQVLNNHLNPCENSICTSSQGQQKFQELNFAKIDS